MELGITTQPKLTPMMEQYRSVKKNLPSDTILFFRLGDFYEMFFEDAVKASEILDITLTGREGGEAGRVPMCGVPYHSYQGYVKTLLEHQLKVAICEQILRQAQDGPSTQHAQDGERKSNHERSRTIGDPKLTKGIVERKVTRIITPASYLEDEAASKQSEYMCAIVASGEHFGLAYLDLSTGKFFVREIAAERLLSELTLLNPRELVLPASLANKGEWLTSLKEMLSLTVTVYEDWVFAPTEGARLLVENFKLGSDRALGFYDHPVLISAAGAMLYYLRDHLHEALDHLQVPELLDYRDFMSLDREVQKSLELVASFSGRKDAPTLLSTLDRTLTSMGARTLHDWITHPLITRSEIEKRQEAVSELVQDPTRLDSLRNLLKGIRDMERTLGRLNYGVASARDLVNLREFLRRAPELRSHVILNSSAVILSTEGAKDLKTEILRPCGPQNDGKAKLLLQIAEQIKPFPHLESLIHRAIVDEPPLGVRDGGMIREGFSRELDALREIAKGGKNWILDFEKREILRTGIKSLKVKYSQVFGYAIEISKSNLHLTPPDYIRRQTLANAERFVVPELKEWDEKISGAEDRIKGMEYGLFNEVRRSVLEELVPLQEMARAIGKLDALISLAVIAKERSWIKPVLFDDLRLKIEAGRHPVVESTLSSGQFIPNDTYLMPHSPSPFPLPEGEGNKKRPSSPLWGEDTGEGKEEFQLIVLTGPNMAGKSTYIRQVAQLVLLAQIGSFVPAKSAEIGVVDRIFTRVGSSDDLARGESTFMVEMLETAKIIRNATERSLLILDEVGRGTSTFDGVSIAWAICEYLAGGAGFPPKADPPPVEKLAPTPKPRTLFATHYHELTQLEEHFPGIKNFHITVRETGSGIIFLRKVVRGGSDRSYGIHVARLAGIPAEITRRAEEILGILESENTQATQIIEAKQKKRNVGARSPRQNACPGVETTPLLFNFAPQSHPILDEIKRMAIETMTPLQALNKLNEIRDRLSQDQPKGI